MSSIKPEVVEFRDQVDKSLGGISEQDDQQKAFVESFTMMFSVLVDIRDLLKK